MRDRLLLYVSAVARAIAYGACGVVLGVHLGASGFDARAIGAVTAAGLAGCALASGLAGIGADRARRGWLGALALLSAAGCATLAVAGGIGVAPTIAAACIGMVNGMGKDRGAQQVIEQALLPATVDDAGRTRAIAVYTMLQDLGHGLGALAAGLPAFLLAQSHPGLARGALDAAGAAAALWACAALFLLSGACGLGISPALHAAPRGSRRLSPASRPVVLRLCALFSLDAIGGGVLVGALLSWFFVGRFGVTIAEVGWLFAGARVLNALSHLAAAWLARRIGLVNTMVFTHIPSSLLLMTVAIAPSFPVAAALFLLREGLVEMDVPTRQSYVLAVVRPDERTAVNAATSLVRMGGWALGAAVAGALIDAVGMGAALVGGASLKIAYDVLLWRSFRHRKPPEELR